MIKSGLKGDISGKCTEGISRVSFEWCNDVQCYIIYIHLFLTLFAPGIRVLLALGGCFQALCGPWAKKLQGNYLAHVKLVRKKGDARFLGDR